MHELVSECECVSVCEWATDSHRICGIVLIKWQSHQSPALHLRKRYQSRLALVNMIIDTDDIISAHANTHTHIHIESTRHKCIYILAKMPNDQTYKIKRDVLLMSICSVCFFICSNSLLHWVELWNVLFFFSLSFWHQIWYLWQISTMRWDRALEKQGQKHQEMTNY